MTDKELKRLKTLVLTNIVENLSYNKLREKISDIVSNQIDAGDFPDFFQWIEQEKAERINKTLDENNLIISYKYFRQVLDIAIVEELLIDAYIRLGHDINFKWIPMGGLVSDFIYRKLINDRYADGDDKPPVVIPDKIIMAYVSAEYRSLKADQTHLDKKDSNIFRNDGDTEDEKSKSKKTDEKEEEKSPEELITGEKSKKWTFKDDFGLCERLSNNEYVPTPEEELRMKDKTFKSNRTKWWDRPERKYRDKFVNIIEELKHQTQIEATKFSEILNVKSDYHRDALLNAFTHAVNHSDGKLYAKANNKKVSIKKNRKGKILLLD